MYTKPSSVDAAHRLGQQEMLTLKALANGQLVRISSTQRLRFEMLGLVEDQSAGIAITPAGIKLLAAWRDSPADLRTKDHPLNRIERNRRGRRMPNKRSF
jgi:hypothetical protein